MQLLLLENNGLITRCYQNVCLSYTYKLYQEYISTNVFKKWWKSKLKCWSLFILLSNTKYMLWSPCAVVVEFLDVWQWYCFSMLLSILWCILTIWHLFKITDSNHQIFSKWSSVYITMSAKYKWPSSIFRKLMQRYMSM